MPRTKKPAPPPRAKKGSTPERLLLSLPADLRAMAEVAARAEGIAVAEWWRRAGRERALHQARGNPELQAAMLAAAGE